MRGSYWFLSDINYLKTDKKKFYFDFNSNKE